MAPKLKDMATWTELIGHAQLRFFVDDEGHFWLEQNSTKQSKWAKLAREGHDVAWEFAGRDGSYTRVCLSMANFIRRPRLPRSSCKPVKNDCKIKSRI
jgi:hypothetical protein